MRSHIDGGGWISVVIDEWRSTRNRKYLNVTVVGSGGFRCYLGLSRIIGAATAENCHKILKVKLSTCELDIDKDVANITDGGSNVCKLV